MKTRGFEVVCGLHKRTSGVMAICLSLLLGAAPSVVRSQEQSDIAPGSALGGIVSSNLNPLQIALLHWYGANQTTSFTVGSSPFGIAFDGANVWIANFSSNNVTKLRANDGASLGTFTVGTSPSTLAYDGANMWVANTHSNNVTKLRGRDGALLGTFTVGSGPTGICFDGANMWVTNVNTNTVTKLRASDGHLLGTFTVGGSNAAACAFDGANIWVANNGSSNVSKLRASDGHLLGTFPTGMFPSGVAFDGAKRHAF